MSRHQGRRVTDPKPVSRVDIPDHANAAGLQEAWGAYSKTKSLMRRAEFRISEAEKPTSYDIGLGPVGDTHIPVDRVPSYTINSQDSDRGTYLDDYGRTAYMKSKMNARKISRMEDKYKEDPEPDIRLVRPRSPLRESTQNYDHHKEKHKSSSQNHRSRYSEHKDRDRKSKKHDLDLNLKPVKYTDGKSQSSGNKVYWSDEPDKYTGSSNLTDLSSDARYINDTNQIKQKSHRSRLQQQPEQPKLTHVDIVGTTNQGPPSTYPKSGSGKVNQTYTVDSKKLIKLEDFRKKANQVGLEGLKEKILRQKMNMSSDTGSDNSFRKEIPPHHDNEVIVPKDYSLYESHEKPVTRKIASGPVAPHYRGFNEAETRYKVANGDGSVMKTSELQRYKNQIKSTEQGLDLKPVRDPDHQKMSRLKQQPEKDKTPKKMTRVIARKPSKQDHQTEVITTTSWREGQKLVQKELGRMPKVREEIPGRESTDVGKESRDSSKKESREKKEKLPERGIGEGSATKPMSANARAILEDLKSDRSDSESEGESRKEKEEKQQHKRSPPFKRKRPKSLEPVREEKKIKVPTYDRKDVQMYMKKKQSEQKQQEQLKREEERVREEKKKENLKKLYDKQRETAKRSGSKGASAERVPFPNGMIVEGSQSGSDKENHHMGMEESSDSGTLTERSEPVAKVPTYRETTTRKPSPGIGEKKDREVEDIMHQYLKKDKVSKEEEKKLKEQTTQELIQKYLKSDAEAKKEQSKPELQQAVFRNIGYKPEEIINLFAEAKKKKARESGTYIEPVSYKRDVIPHVDPLMSSVQGSNKMERKRNLQLMSHSLSNKLKTSAATIESVSVHKWAQPVFEEGEEFVSRYDRITGGRYQQDVFTGDLPGVGSTYAVERSRNQNEAASKIQAAYRGHNVRQTMASWKPKERPSNSADDLSESTPTEELETNYRPGTKGLSTRMAKPGYCVGDSSKSTEEHRLLEKYLKPSTKPKNKYAWDEQKINDPFTVFDAYARKQKLMRKDYKVKESSEEDMVLSDASDKNLDITPRTTERAKSPGSLGNKSKLSQQRSQSPPSVSYKDDFETTSAISKSQNVTASQIGSVYSAKPSQHSGAVPPRREAEGQESRPASEIDDTLEGATLSPSIEDSEPKKEETVNKSSSRSKRSVSIEDKGSDVSDRSFSYSEDSEPIAAATNVKDPILHYSREGTVTYPKFGKTGYDVPRMSPAALEHRMMVELGRYEGLEESVRQVTDVDRARGISTAQQESVSLAQILKAKQEMHMQDMANLQMKVSQEKTLAARQMEESQKRASEAAHSAAKVIHEVRTETGKSFEENTRLLIESQANAAKATFEAAKQLAERSSAYHKQHFSVNDANIKAVVEAAMAQYAKKHMGMPQGPRMETGTQYSTHASYAATATPYTTDISRTERSNTYASDSFESQSSYMKAKDKDTTAMSESVLVTADDSSVNKTESIKSDAPTAEDMSKRSSDSIQTESGAVGKGTGHSPSQTDSIPEAYPMDSSLTEEEAAQVSRDLLPSEGQRRKLKKTKGYSDVTLGSFSEDFPTVSSRRLSFEDDSFSKFLADFYEQYVHQEEMRQKHQDMLLKLREKAINEKLSAEMAWYDQQKKQLRDKGADDKYPQLKKKQRGVILKLKQEQAEIKKLQEASLRQQENLKQTRQHLKNMKHASKQPHSRRGVMKHLTSAMLSDSSETDLSVQGDEPLSSPHKDYKSDSEIYSESNGRPPSPSDAKVMKKLNKRLDEKYLTVREQHLLQRRKKAQDLLLWKVQLDKEETEVEAMERKALALYGEKKKSLKNKKKEGAGKRDTSPLESKTDSKDTVINTKNKSMTQHRNSRGDRTESVATDIATDIANETMATDYANDTIATEKGVNQTHTGRSITEDLNYTKSHDRSYDKSYEYTSNKSYTQIESSIQEEDGIKKTHDSSDDTIINTSVEYSNETFEDPTTHTSRKTNAASVASQKPKGHDRKAGPEKSNKKFTTKTEANGKVGHAGRRGSESESDESVSMAYSVENTSDASDIEARIRVLHEDLRQRKLEAEKLKKEQRKHKKERLKKEEEALKKKIEATDGYIHQVQDELNREHEQDPASIKPQIKVPQAKILETPLTVTTSANKSRSDSESKATSPGIKGKIVSLPADKKPQRLNKQDNISHYDKSELIESFTEDISEAFTAQSETQDKSEVKLILDLAEKEDAQKQETEYKPDTARSISEIPEEPSSLQTGPPILSRSEKSDKLKKQDSSFYSEYTEDYEESDISHKSDRSHSHAKSSKSSHISTSDTYSDSLTRTESKNRKNASNIKQSSVISDLNRDQLDTSVNISKSEQPRSLVIERADENRKKTTAQQKSTEKATDEDITESIESALDEEVETAEDEEEQLLPLKFDLKSSLDLSQEFEDPLADVEIGSRVLINVDGISATEEQKLPGTLKFKGYTKFAPGYYAGVELDAEKEGGHNGSVEGEEYFRSKEGHGTFVPAEQVCLMPADYISINIQRSSQDSVENIEGISDDILIDDIKTPISPRKSQEDSVLDRAIKEAEIAVVDFHTEDISEPVPSDDLRKEGGIELESPETTPTKRSSFRELIDEAEGETEDLTKKTKATENVAENLVNEAISEILDIRKKKVVNLSEQKEVNLENKTQEEDDDDDDEFDDIDIPLPVDVDSESASSKIINDQQVTVRPIDELPPPRPQSPDIPTLPSDVDNLYNEISSMTGDDFWDEDFGIGFKSKPDEVALERSPEMKLIQNLTQEVFYAVPNKRDDIEDVVENTIDFFWEKRRYGESWEGEIEAPTTLYKTEDKGTNMESKCRKVYKHLVFDLTGEVLRDMYAEEDKEESEEKAWVKPKPVKRKVYKGKTPPTTATDLKPLMKDHVSKYLSVDKDSAIDAKSSKIGGRKKKDNVDQILIQELREEEPDWVNYDADELSVKEQLSDAIFDTLLAETGHILSRILEDRS